MTVPKPARLRIDNLPTVFPNAAGLDIGSAEIVAALPPDRDVTLSVPHHVHDRSQTVAKRARAFRPHPSTGNALTGTKFLSRLV